MFFTLRNANNIMSHPRDNANNASFDLNNCERMYLVLYMEMYFILHQSLFKFFL